MSSNLEIGETIQTTIIVKLPSEVWFLIFNQIWLEVRNIGKAELERSSEVKRVLRWLRDMRLVSFGMDEAVRPLVFKIMDLNRPNVLRQLDRVHGIDPVLDQQWDRFKGSCCANINTHMLLLEVGDTCTQTQSQELVKIISNTPRLIRLRYNTDNRQMFDAVHPMLPAYIGAFFQGTWKMYMNVSSSRTILSRSREPPSTLRKLSILPKYRLTPASKSSHVEPHTSKRLQKVVALRCNYVQEEPVYAPPLANFRFPAADKIKLHRYTPATDILPRFDFSKLRTLSISQTYLFSVLSIIPVEHLKELKRLKFQSYMALTVSDATIVETFRALVPQLRKLIKFNFECGPWHYFLDPLDICNMPLLEKLSLTNAKEKVGRPLSLDELEEIRTRCTLTRVLKIDYFDIESFGDMMQFMKALAQFKTLEVLTLIAFHQLRTELPFDAGCTDIDYDVAWGIIMWLVAHKSGKSWRGIQILIRDCKYPELWCTEERAKGVVDPVPPNFRVFGAAYNNDEKKWFRVGEPRIGGSPSGSSEQMGLWQRVQSCWFSSA